MKEVSAQVVKIKFKKERFLLKISLGTWAQDSWK